MTSLADLRISLMITLTNLVNGLDNLHSTGDSPTYEVREGMRLRMVDKMLRLIEMRSMKMRLIEMRLMKMCLIEVS